MDKKWIATISSDDGDATFERPKLTISQQVAYMRDVKGIKFTIVNEEQAERFLQDNNYYFKVKAFEKNYSKYSHGENAGKYCDLEFAYLQELSTLDMYLRAIILSMTLDIEHYLKVQLLKDISNDPHENGYAIVDEFMSMHPLVSQTIDRKARNSYCEELVHKYSHQFAAWNIVEVLSFGDLLDLCDTYYYKQNAAKIRVGNFRIVKFLRNAAAHNNCLINNLADNSGIGFSQNREANNFVASIGEISAKVRGKKMGNRFIHDFVVMLCCFRDIVSSPGVRCHQLKNLKDLIDNRFIKHRDYFTDNALLCSNYSFIKKVVDKISTTCI